MPIHLWVRSGSRDARSVWWASVVGVAAVGTIAVVLTGPAVLIAVALAEAAHLLGYRTFAAGRGPWAQELQRLYDRQHDPAPRVDVR